MFFEKLVTVSIKDFDINPFYSVSLTGFTWLCGLNYAGIFLRAPQGKEIISI